MCALRHIAPHAPLDVARGLEELGARADPPRVDHRRARVSVRLAREKSAREEREKMR